MSLPFGLLSAFGLGALHALEPGHGKGIMGTYLVLSHGRARDAVKMGLITALTHTLVVLTLALGARSTAWLAAAASGAPRDRFALWLQLGSGIMVVLIGLRLLLTPDRHCHAHVHRHNRPAVTGPRSGDTAGLLLVGVSNGLMPCPGALAVLLLSIGSGTAAGGLAMVAAFGLGGAAALVGVGLLFVKLSSLADRLFDRAGWWKLTAVSGILIAALGSLTAWEALKHLVRAA